MAVIPEPERTGRAAAPGLAKWLVLYSALRLATLVVLTAVLYLVGIPLILALLFAVILALPLSWLVFAPVRRQVTAAMAVASAHRRAERDRLRTALDGNQST